MRIERLELERFGIFDGHALDLSGDAGLHVVYGPNEGGKSTALAAICDLLFGFPPRTPYDFRHSYDRLRLGAVLTNAAGQTLAFKRRKGRTNTLLTPDEAALPDGALAPFLGGMGRDDFERMFALDHARLRRGGDTMRGDLSRSLFEAGSGLSGVALVAAGLERDLDMVGALDGKRASSKPYWIADAALKDAQDRIRRGALKADEWATASGAVQAAEERRLALNAALAALHRRRSRLDRIRRVLPILRRLDDAAARLMELAGSPDLPDGIEARWHAALQARHAGVEEVARAGEALEALERTTAALVDPGPWLVHADEVEALVTDLGDYRSKLADEPKLAREIALAEARIADLLRELGSAVPADGGDPQLPPRPVIARIREQCQLRAALAAQRDLAEREVTEAEETLRAKEGALAALGSPEEPTLARAALEQAGDGRNLAVQLRQAELQLEEGRRDLAAALGALGRWEGTAEALAALPVPAAALVAEHERAADARAADRARCTAEEERLLADRRRLGAELEGLQAGGAVPTPDAVRAARLRRDALWSDLRRAHVEARVPDAAEDAALEAALREADDLADRVAVEAKRIADFAKLTAARVQADSDLAEMRRRLEVLDAQSATAKADWLALWPMPGVTPGRPGEMREWLQRREEVLRRLDAVRKAESLLNHLRAEDEGARGHLLRAAVLLGIDHPDGLDTAVLRDKVRASFLAADQTWQESLRLRNGIDECRQIVSARRRELAAVQARLSGWAEAWAADMPLIGLPQQAGPAAVEAALAIWETVGSTLASLSISRRRREGIRHDLDAYAARLDALLGRLGPDGASLAQFGDREEVVRHMSQHLAAARAAATRRDEHERQLARSRQLLAAARDRLHRAETELQALRATHGLDSDADVPALARTALERARHLARVEEARADLLDHGDGLDEAALRAEAGEMAPDALAAELVAVEEEGARLNAAVQEAASAAAAAAADLRALEARDGIGSAAQDAANAIHAMAEHGAGWARLKVAAHILSRAVEHYRAANEHPLVRRASELFGLMAGTGDNPIARLSVDYADADDPVLVGVRQDGSLCPVNGMSEGTRDQLYLALRIAAVERAIAEGEPMPFIVDDIFITSDERRTTAGLRALMELGRTTQVLLFTHHLYVVDAAMTLPGSRIHRLREAEAAEAVAEPEPVPA